MRYVAKFYLKNVEYFRMATIFVLAKSKTTKEEGKGMKKEAEPRNKNDTIQCIRAI